METHGLFQVWLFYSVSHPGLQQILCVKLDEILCSGSGHAVDGFHGEVCLDVVDASLGICGNRQGIHSERCTDFMGFLN